MLGQLTCLCSTAHSDVFQGPAKTRQSMSLEMSHRKKSIGIQITAADLGHFYEILIDLDITDIPIFSFIRDEDTHPHSSRCKTMGHGNFKMIF